MDYRVDWDPESGHPTVELSGTLLPSDLTRMVGELWADTAYAAASHAIWDFSDCETHYHFDDIFNLFSFVREHKESRGPSTVAVVAPRDLEFGMTRMYASLSESLVPRIRVFRTRAEARAWIRDAGPAPAV